VVKEKINNVIRLQEYYVCACIYISPSITHAKVTVGFGVGLRYKISTYSELVQYKIIPAICMHHCDSFLTL